MKRALPIFLSLILISIVAQSQVLTVTGKVISGTDNQTIPGATVQVKNKTNTNATVTDINGNYTLKGVKSDDSLVFSFIGYTKQVIPVNGRTSIDVVLQVTSLELKEVVVTALGITRQKRELGFATEKLNGDVVVRSSAPNIISAMTGRSAGVVVSNNDGIEGGTTRIVIRGANSFNKDNQPLIIVDGVMIENAPGQTDVGRGQDWGNSVNNINSFDIETYNILKGGAATALYGSRGGNGVILITTKRGKQQKGIGITYNLTEKITHPYRYREVQNKYGAGGPISFTAPTFPVSSMGDTLLYPGTYGNDNLIINQQGQTSSTSAEFGYYGGAVSWGPEMNGEMVKWWDGKMRSWSPQPDNLKIPFHDGYTTTHNISASGGNETGTVRVSITRMDQKPIVDNSNMDQTTINFAGNMKVSSKLKADITMSYTNYNRLNSIMTGEDWGSLNKGLLYSWPRSYQGEDKENYANPDGSQNQMADYPYQYVNSTIWWDYYNNNTTLTKDNYLGTMSLIYDISPWLNMVVKAGKDFTFSNYETKNKPTDVVGVKNGKYANQLERLYSNTLEVLLSGTEDNILNTGINMKCSAGASSWTRKMYTIKTSTGTWYYPNMYSLINYTNPTYLDSANNIYLINSGDALKDVAATETISRQKINSVYCFMNLGYKGYLFMDLTGRNDWSSTLPKSSNSYFYPSATVSFIVSDAFKLHEKYHWLDFLKIRACVAQTATGDAPFQTEFYYTTGFFGGQQSSTFPNTIPPFELVPQRVNNYESGLNFSILNNRIDVDLSYYYGYSYDQIMFLPVPISSGASNIKINNGSLSNKGIELSINAIPYQSKDLVIRSGFNFAKNKSKILSLGKNNDVYPLADIWGLDGPAMEIKVGEEFGTIIGWDYVYDKNGNRIVNDAGTKYLTTTDRVPIGNASPDFTAGWTTEITWKNFRLSTLVDTKWGGDIYCGSYVIGLQTGQSPETLKERDGGGLPYTDPSGHTSNVGVILEGVHEDGTPNTTVVHYYYKYLNAGGWGKMLSKPGILENTWVKMREIALSYTFTPKALKKLNVFQSLTITLTGRDLFYFYSTLPDKINPEGIMGSGNAQGFEWASLPSSRSFIFSINASF